jgi:hypothetical protein
MTSHHSPITLRRVLNRKRHKRHTVLNETGFPFHARTELQQSVRHTTGRDCDTPPAYNSIALSGQHTCSKAPVQRFVLYEIANILHLQ